MKVPPQVLASKDEPVTLKEVMLIKGNRGMLGPGTQQGFKRVWQYVFEWYLAQYNTGSFSWKSVVERH